MGVFDAVVAGLSQAGLMVLLNNHNSGAGWCCRWGSPCILLVVQRAGRGGAVVDAAVPRGGVGGGAAGDGGQVAGLVSTL